MGHAKGELPGTPASAWLGWVVAGVCFVGLLIAWGAYESRPTVQVVERPVCSNARDVQFPAGTTVLRVPMLPDCWSGLIITPVAAEG